MEFFRSNARWLLAGMLLTFGSSFGQTFFISIFAGEIRESFGLTHGSWGTIYAAGTFTSALVMIWAGALTDQYRVRALALVVLPGFALACLAMAAAPSVWMLPIVIFALRLAGQGMMSHIAVVAMARWFVATRGRALSIASFGFALGEAVLPVVFVAALVFLPWRALWIVAALLLLCALPVLQWLLSQERTPQSDIEANVSLGMSGRHWSRREMLHHWLFWMLIPLLLGPPTFSTAYFFHQVHFAETKQISHLTLVSLFPIYTVVAVTAMLLSGFVIDRIGTARLMPLFQLPMGLAFLTLSLATGATGVAGGMAIMALTVGTMHTIMGAFWAEFYGTQHLGAIKAMAAAVGVFGTAVGPIVTGLAIDGGVSLDSQMLWIGGYFLFACALTGFAIRRAAASLPSSHIDVERT